MTHCAWDEIENTYTPSRVRAVFRIAAPAADTAKPAALPAGVPDVTVSPVNPEAAMAWFAQTGGKIDAFA